jgi:hypothetical protein
MSKRFWIFSGSVLAAAAAVALLTGAVGASKSRGTTTATAEPPPETAAAARAHSPRWAELVPPLPTPPLPDQGRADNPPAEAAGEPREQAPAPTKSWADAKPETLSRLDTRLRAEPVDPGWAPRAQQTARTVVTELFPGESRVLSLDCHSTFCRAEIEHGDADVHRQGVDRIRRGAISWSGQFLLTDRDETGRARSLLYLAKQGHELPAL